VSSLFFSYSHVDESLRDQLEKHLSGLRRQGVISAWHDRRITAGTDLGKAIDNYLDTADLILLLISPDFIASDYCYEREMGRAIERHRNGEARVIPVILRPCDWHGLPFGDLLATPKDGLPITMWPNIDQAFLEVVTAIKCALEELGQTTPSPTLSRLGSAGSVRDLSEPIVRSSNLRIKKQFTDRDKDIFRIEGFEYIAKFFANSLEELSRRNPGLQRPFGRQDPRFFAILYREAKKFARDLSASAGELSVPTVLNIK